MQDILKLKVSGPSRVNDYLQLTFPKSSAINTISGVNMTTRRQMLKIKVSPFRLTSLSFLILLLQGMSEAKVEKIKVSRKYRRDLMYR